MSWLEIGLILAVTFAVVIAAAIAAAYLGGRLFAALIPMVDRWRPTGEGETRPGHVNLGVGATFLIASVAAFAWYDLAGVLANLPRSLHGASLQGIVALGIVLLVLPLLGIAALLVWKNQRIERQKNRIRIVSSLGHQTDWIEVVSASVAPSARGPGMVWFERADGYWTRVYTDWINIRAMYEALARAGVVAQPWPEQAPKKSFWSC